jgi:hypothetical protein
MLTLTTPASAAAADTGLAVTGHGSDPDLRAMVREVDPGRIQAIIRRLTQFGTRHTLSSQTDPVRGIGAATAWVLDQMQAIAATSSGRMTVQEQSFVQPAGDRIPTPTKITNVIATLQGTASPQRFYVVTGHLDSRVTDVLDFTSDAPGADDDGSGVAVVLELARIFATRKFPGAVRADGHERPGDLAAGPVPAGQRPRLLPGSGVPGGQVHRAAGELQPRAPER